MARPTRICGLVLFALLALPTAPALGAGVSLSVSPSVLNGAGPWTVSYAIEFDAGPLDEHLTVSVSGNGVVAPDPTVEGPGALTAAHRQLASSFATCAFGSVESGVDGGASYDLLLPPATKTTLHIQIAVTHPFGLADTRVDDLRVTVDNSPLDLPSPTLAMARTVPLQLQFPERPIALGRRVAIKGRTSPQLAGDTIDLLAAYAPTTGYVSKPKYTTRVGHAKVGPTGAFVYRWRPPRAGRWGFKATYRSQDPRFLDSATSGCSDALQVGPATT